MPRKLRVEFPGAVYHVMCRGDRQEAIFLDDRDRERFLETLAEAQERTGWRIHAFVLMSNHYHLLLETPEPNLVAGMRWFQGTYTVRFNLRHRLGGHLFQGRYRALPVAPGEAGYFLSVSTYIHLNPARAGLVRGGEARLEGYRWSSYPEYLKPPRKRTGLVEVERVLGDLHLEDKAAGRRAYAAYIEERRAEWSGAGSRKALEAEWKQIRRGWCLGSEPFREKLQGLMEGSLRGKRRESFSGPAVRGHEEAAARQLLASGFQALGLSEEDLPRLRKLELRKQVLAWWVRKQTTVSNRWLSEHLHMGHAGNLSKVVRAVETETLRGVKPLKRRIERLSGMRKIPKSED